MAVKKVVKEVVDKVKKVITPKIETVKTEVKLEGCLNCGNSGVQCSVCTPAFEDTFK